MRSSEKRLLIAKIVCVVAIAIALAFKLFGTASFTASRPPVPLTSSPGSVNTDPAFYNGSTTAEVVHPSNATHAPAPKPQITASAYVVGNVVTGKIYLQKNASVVLPVASMSKLITAIAATDTLSPDTRIQITDQEYDVASDTSKIVPRESFTVLELLYPMLLNSSNVAAEALASTTDRAKFMELMTSYAWEVGMPSTFFADPSGINPRNQSTASDFFALARYLYKYRPDILAITRIPRISVATTTDHMAHDFISIHPFVSDPAFLGGKTGHTPEAGDTMLTIMKIAGQPVAIVILGADSGNRERDTRLLISKTTEAIQ